MDATKYNNIFKTDQHIDNLINYLNTRIVPSSVKSVPTLLRQAKEFIVEKGRLVLKTSGQVVVKSTEREAIMKKIYKDIKMGAGKGIVTFYKLVCSKYINIRRSDCEDFLKAQAYYQLQQPLNHVVNKPIVATYPNEIYAMDLIDMSNYSNFNFQNSFILTVVDIFSGKCFLGKLTKKEALKITNEFDRIAPIYPSHILCDNGTEFKGEFLKYCKDHEIKIRNTSTYSPQANGVAENKNKQIRKVIRDIFLRTNKKNWSQHLDKIAENLNNTYHSKKKTTPNALWADNKDQVKVPHRRLPESIESILSLQQKEVLRMRRKQELFDEKTLEKGDYVRVKMNALYSGVRSIVKAENGKLLVVKYTPDIYRVAKVVKPRNTQKLEYYIENKDGKRPNRSFFLSDLQKVEANANDGLAITTERALDLNGTWFIDENDNIGHD
jgi:hypothetical protein